MSEGLLAPISPQPIPDMVFDRISRAIIGGKLQPGQRLNELAVAEEMGVSQTSVREAFLRLERHGLLVKFPRRATLVRTWNRTDLMEIASLRASLEGLAARLACANLTAEDSAALSATIAEMEAALQREDHDALIELDLAFHRQIWAIADHRLLAQTLDGMKLRTRLFMTIVRGYDVVDYPSQRRQLLDALRSGDAEIAEQCAISHVMEAAELALEAMRDREGLVAGAVALREQAGY